MPRKDYSGEESDLKEFIKLTWEIVRRNPGYRADYKKFKKANPGGIRKAKFDANLRRYVWDDEAAPDPELCNLSYMMQRWGFACDPDKFHPCGSYWSGGLISNETLKQRKEGGPLFLNGPLILDHTELRRLPGVLEVKKWPDSKLTEESILKQQEALRLVKDGWRPQTHQESQEFEALTRDQWEIEDPPCITISINLKAPSHLILHTLKFLITICKKELRIKEKRIEKNYIMKCLEIYDLHQKGYSEEDIADEIDLTHYKEEEALRDGLDDYLKEWGVPQVKRCIKNAETMIEKGNII